MSCLIFVTGANYDYHAMHLSCCVQITQLSQYRDRLSDNTRIHNISSIVHLLIA